MKKSNKILCKKLKNLLLIKSSENSIGVEGAKELAQGL
jgi:hypothetical protein